jgi:hypothetical protein
MTKGGELIIQNLFENWLVGRGWTLAAERGWVDVDAQHPDGRRLLAEVKGPTSSPGLDVDTAYGQLLRRTGEVALPKTRFGIVVPESSLKAALRVPERVRQVLAVDVFAVSSSELVQQI